MAKKMSNFCLTLWYIGAMIKVTKIARKRGKNYGKYRRKINYFNGSEKKW